MTVPTLNGHFVYWTGSALAEAHVNDIINNIDQIPVAVKSGFLILVLRYVNPDTGTELWPHGFAADTIKLGHFIAGSDHYYVNFQPAANPDHIEYSYWTGNTTGNTRVTIYELRGENLETKQTNVRANTLPNARIFDGFLVSDADYNTALAMAASF